MLYQIVGFILQMIEGLLAGTCLLRLLFHFQRISLSANSGNPLGPFIFATTNWIVLPIRRFIPSIGRLDTASLLSAFLIILAKASIMWLINSGVQPYLVIIGVSVFGLFQMCLSCLNGLVLVYAVMTWISSNSSVIDIFSRLVNPMLRPIQKVLPLFGGIDLSPLALLALIQIGIMLLQNLEGQILGLIILAS